MICTLLAGVIIGFVLSPVKKGIMLGSKNGCNNEFHSVAREIKKAEKINKKLKSKENIIG